MSLRNVRVILLVLAALEVVLLIWGPQPQEHVPEIKAALAAKEKPDWWDDAAMGLRHAAWINLGLLILLLITSKWWTQSRALGEIHNPQSAIRNPKWFWPLLLLALLTTLSLRLPLASKSLWWDESWVMFQAVHGKWRPDTKKPGELKFQAHDWKRCAFYYQKPTNHAPMSLAQKSSLSVWRKLTDAKAGGFSELAARTPALLASCAAVLLLAVLLRSWGWPGAGIAAGFLLALHPWHVRYGVDARAYALVVPLCVAGMFAVSRLWQSRGASVAAWFYWGFVEFLWLWAYPNALLDVALLNVLLVIVFLRDKEAGPTGLVRWVVTNLFAAMALLQVFLPNVMQAMRWAGDENVAQPLNLVLIKSTLSHLFLGVEHVWAKSVEAEGLVSSAVATNGTDFPIAMLALAVSVLVLVFSRWRSTTKVAPRHWLLLSLPVASSLLFAAFVSFSGSYFYQRFVIAMLPCVIALIVMLFADALTGNNPAASQPGGKNQTRRALALAALVLPIFAIARFWIAQDRLLMTRPYAPLRDVADFMRAAANEPASSGKKGLVVCYGHGHEVMPLYLPQVLPALSRADLEKFINEARAEARPLLVMQGHSVHNRALIPDGFTLLDDKTVFEEVKAFAGIDPEFYFRVFRLKL